MTTLQHPTPMDQSSSSGAVPRQRSAGRLSVRPAAHRPRTPSIALGLIGAGAAAVTALWWHAAAPLTDLAAVLTEAGRLTGLLGSYAMVVLVLLMARLPPLENGIGADRLARWHGRGGRWGVLALMAHAVLITWGYAVAAHTGLPSQSVTLLRSYPDVLAATVGLGLLLGAAGISIRAARSRLRYETWYLLHLYTYLGLALALAHQLATGSAFLDGPARLAWLGLYLGTALAVVRWRVALPLVAFRRHRVRVVTIVSEAPGVASLHLHGRDLALLGGSAGQFIRIRVLDRQHWWQSHPFSLSAPPESGRLRVTVKDLGDGSRSLAGVRPGTRVLVEGPYGAMTHAVRTRRKVLLLAAGIGIAPLRALLETLPAGHGDLTLVHRVRSDADRIFTRELAHLATVRGARVHVVSGPRGGSTDLTPARLRDLVPDLAEHDVFLCGPVPWLDATSTALRTAGVPASRVHAEHFTF